MSNCVLHGAQGYRLLSQVGCTIEIGLKRRAQHHVLTLMLRFFSRWSKVAHSLCSGTFHELDKEAKYLISARCVHACESDICAVKCYMLSIELLFMREKAEGTDIDPESLWSELLYAQCSSFRSIVSLSICFFGVFAVGLSQHAAHGARRNGAEYKERHL